MSINNVVELVWAEQPRTCASIQPFSNVKNRIITSESEKKRKGNSCFYLLTSQDNRQRGPAGGPGDKRGLTEGPRPQSEGERPWQPLTYRREREREGGRQSISQCIEHLGESVCLPCLHPPVIHLSVTVCLSDCLSACLRSTSVSCWLSASCLQGNRIHEPQIAPPSRVSLRHIEPHRSPSHFKTLRSSR